MSLSVRPDQGRTQLSQEKNDQGCHGSCLKTRCTTLVPTPSVLPILRMPSPLALNSNMRASTEGLTRPPAQLRTFRPSASKTRVYSFANDPTLELGKHAKHLKHRFARSRRSIESLLVEEQTDALVMKALEYAEQVGERSSEPIH